MKNFNELSLSEPLMRALNELGFETPSPIQAEALPKLLGQNTDFLGLAATGTGKTAAFSIPMLERLDRKKPGVQALILCPTRELAIQVAGQIDLLGKYKDIRALPVYGGTGYGDQIYGLRNGASVVVGTPGRVIDHIEKGYLKLDKLETLILDEADEMMSMGFKDDIEAVLKAVPEGQANIWLFSATMGRDVRKVVDSYLQNPASVQINRTEMLPESIEQIYYKIHEYDKPDLVCKLIDMADDFYGIIFCQTKSLVADLSTFLVGRGYKADCLHGDLDQQGRDRVMKAFRDRKIKILIATDVACRGLDVKDVTHVINYSIPRELDNYVHRIGRTGRSGKAGLALSLVTNSHRGLISQIEHMTKRKMTEGAIPTGKEIALKRVGKILSQLQAASAPERAHEVLGDDWKAALEGLSKEEIAARFINLMQPELFTARDRAGRMNGATKTEVRPEKTDGGNRREARRGDRRERPRDNRREERRESYPKRDGRFQRSKAPSFSTLPGAEEKFVKPKFQEKKFEEKSEKTDRRTPPWEQKQKKVWEVRPKKKKYGQSKKPFSAHMAARPDSGKPFNKDFSKSNREPFAKKR